MDAHSNTKETYDVLKSSKNFFSVKCDECMVTTRKYTYVTNTCMDANAH